MKIYNHKKLEKLVQKYWKKYNIFKTKYNIKKKKYYCLCMIPYPSGNLHIGHVRNYTIGDIISRYQRLKKKNVLHPIGWDSFGLPAENAAIKHKLSPKIWIKKNIKKMKKQLKKIGISYDWDREINTCKEKYYKWEQWLLIKLFNKKLLYKKKDIVNWCPKDKTVLANEQVINNKCWRCNSKIEYKNISQWFLKITKYANKLNNNLDKLKKWPKKVLQMQKKWIGKNKGIEIIFFIYKIKKKIKIFVPNIKILINSSYISISIKNKIVNYIKNLNIIKKFNKLNKKNINKNNYIWVNTNLYVKNPINENKLPIIITNFTEELYNTDILLISNLYYKKYNILDIKNNNNNIVIKKNKIYNILKKLIKKKIIKRKIHFSLKDWVISRQRYWGVPIPIIKINNKIYKTVNINDLPIKLPNIKKNKFYFNYLKNNKLWKLTKFKNKKAYRETDTCDTFIESSWYYTRYVSPNYKKNIFNIKKANYWLPVDTYIGGIEHATMHLIYFRFIHKFLKNIKLLKTNEPVKKLICQGLVLSNTYYYIKNKKKIWIPFYKVKKIKKNNKIKYYKKNTNIELIYAGKNKMSKSKNNGVNPDYFIKKYGSDTLRLFIIFSSPIEKNLNWNEKNIIGCYRFLNKLWNFIFKIKNIKKIKYKNKINKKKHKIINFNLNKTIEYINYDMNYKNNFNISISKIMTFFNFIKSNKIDNSKDLKIIKKCINKILILLYPFAPHITFYLWKILKNKNIIDKSNWPKVNKKYLNIKLKIKIALQINGKTKKIINIKNTYNKIKIIKKIIKENILYKNLKKKKINKIIYIKNKIINFII